MLFTVLRCQEKGKKAALELQFLAGRRVRRKIMATRNSFKSGSCELLVLHILKAYGDCYAYQISQYITELSGGDLSFPEGSLYPAFYKMIDHNYISDYKKQSGKRMVKVYYHIEPEGEKRLEQLLEDYYQVTESIEKILHFDFQSWGKSNE